MLKDTYTSTGVKFFAHQEAMAKLRGGRGQPVTTHVMLTDICNHTCAFCSVQARAGDSLSFDQVTTYIKILLRYGLKSVILSGGGNPILYRCKETGVNFSSIVGWMRDQGLEIGLITNGMPLRLFGTRESWGTVRPETLDKLTWVRVSMSGLDHEEGEVYVPDIDPTLTTLGFSYVAHDVYDEPQDPHHGKVSRRADLLSGDRAPARPFEGRIDDLEQQFIHYVRVYRPKYLRLLPNCLEPELIDARCRTLESVARYVNYAVDREVVFVQEKPPEAPHACYLGYIHPVLNCDGWVYPCDSCVLNDAAGHQFANPWRVCRWDEVGELYERHASSLIEDPAKTCPGCVFTESNRILRGVAEGGPSPHPGPMEHVNFV
jgi:Radical SAM superfamily